MKYDVPHDCIMKRRVEELEKELERHKAIKTIAEMLLEYIFSSKVWYLIILISFIANILKGG